MLLGHDAAGAVDVRSAGSEPATSLNPAVVAVRAERGLDPTQELPKPLTDEAPRAADVVVTMGCGDTCPEDPGTRYVGWELTDPAGQPVEVVRGIVDEIDTRVRALLAELTGPHQSEGPRRTATRARAMSEPGGPGRRVPGVPAFHWSHGWLSRVEARCVQTNRDVVRSSPRTRPISYGCGSPGVTA